jgi:hypothetical protein
MIKGKLFCITGSLENFSLKKEAYEEIIHHGGNFTDKITNACDFLILGAKGNPNYAQGRKGNKQLKAEKWASQGLPIRIISENQFVGFLEASEEVNSEDWGKDLSAQTVKRSSVEKYTENGLEITTCFWPPKPEFKQVLRIEFKTHRTDESIISWWRAPLRATEKVLDTANLRRLIRTEVIPSNWIETNPTNSTDMVLSCRIIALLETEEQKNAAPEIVKTLAALFVETNIGATLSLRIWDETYRYGNYWIKKLSPNN